MNKRSASARILAVCVLVAAFVLAVVVIGGALGGDSEDSNGGQRGDNGSQQADRPERKVPAVYVVESGDTLIGIAHRTGVPVVRIEALNPEVDPQILVAGEELKLR